MRFDRIWLHAPAQGRVEALEPVDLIVVVHRQCSTFIPTIFTPDMYKECIMSTYLD